jgi:hypothetical protein
LHVALGDVLSSDESSFDEATIHYSKALKLNPLSDPARRGKERIEQLLVGENDQDALEEGMEEELDILDDDFI